MVALNTAYAPSKTRTQPKNRVGNFFGRVGDRAGENRPATRKRIGEKRLTLTIIASGRPVWPSRDPIGELGGLNLYGMVFNDPVNLWDFLGLNPCCPNGEPIDCAALRNQNDLLYRLFNNASNALREDLEFQYDSELTLFGVDRAIDTAATIVGVGVGSAVNSARAANASQRASQSLGGQLAQSGQLTHAGSTLTGTAINTAGRVGPGLVAGGATREGLRRPPRWSTQGLRDDIQSNVDNLDDFVQDLADRLSELVNLIRECCQ